MSGPELVRPKGRTTTLRRPDGTGDVNGPGEVTLAGDEIGRMAIRSCCDRSCCDRSCCDRSCCDRSCGDRSCCEADGGEPGGSAERHEAMPRRPGAVMMRRRQNLTRCGHQHLWRHLQKSLRANATRRWDVLHVEHVPASTPRPLRRRRRLRRRPATPGLDWNSAALYRSTTGATIAAFQGHRAGVVGPLWQD